MPISIPFIDAESLSVASAPAATVDPCTPVEPIAPMQELPPLVIPDRARLLTELRRIQAAITEQTGRECTP